MIPQDQHPVIRGIFLVTVFHKIRQRIRFIGWLQSQILDLGKLPLVVEEPLRAVGVDDLIAPPFCAAGLHHNPYIIRPCTRRHLSHVHRSTARLRSDHDILCHNRRGGDGFFGIVKKVRHFQTVLSQRVLKCRQCTGKRIPAFGRYFVLRILDLKLRQG